MKKFYTRLFIITAVFLLALSGCTASNGNTDAPLAENESETVLQSSTAQTTSGELTSESDTSAASSTVLASTEQASKAEEAEKETTETAEEEAKKTTKSATKEQTTAESKATAKKTTEKATEKTEASSTEKEESDMRNIKVEVNGKVFSATLSKNEAAKAFANMLPVTIEMSDYSGFEKVGELGASLPASDKQITTKSGDIILYNSDQIVIFYGSNSWSYTKLGRIDDLSGWEEALGGGDVTVTFSLA